MYAFKESCSEGYLYVARWLYELSINENIKINIHINNNDILKQSCINGHLDVARWLYELSRTDNNVPINISPEYICF